MANESMDAPALLEAAAKLVTRALEQLDVSEKGRCSGCGHRWFNSREQSRAFENLAPLPARLKSIAHKIKHEE